MLKIDLEMVIAILISLLLISCTKDDLSQSIICNDPSNSECPNYDPCNSKTSVSANFEIYSSLGFQDTFFIEYDTILRTSRVKFIASEKEYDTYSWQIGSEPERRQGVEVAVNFGAAYGWIPITLYVSAQPDSLCFPLDQGKDSITYNIFVLDPWAADSVLGIYGKFTGFIEGLNQEQFTIELIPKVELPDGPIFVSKIKGLPNTCELGIDLENIVFNPHSLYIPPDQNFCQGFGIEGFGTLNEDGDSLTIEYSKLDPYSLKPIKKYSFNGMKIQ
jgi:hypothetical protein